MIITVYSLKGGVGKSSISSNLTLELGLKLIDNDPFGGVTELLNKGKKKKIAYSVHEDSHSIPKSKNTVYDFGCFKDNRTHSIIEKSTVVIIPTLHSYSDIKTTVFTIMKIQELGQKNIIVAINRLNTSSKKQIGSKKVLRDYVETKEHIETLCKKNKINIDDILFVGIRENKAWSKSTSKGKSINQLAKTSRLVEKSSEGAIEDLNTLVEAILSYGV